MVLRWPQVLADCQNVHVLPGEIAENRLAIRQCSRPAQPSHRSWSECRGSSLWRAPADAGCVRSGPLIAPPGTAVGQFRYCGSGCRAWASMTIFSGCSSPWKSGISTSTRQSGTRLRISVMVSAKTRAAPTLSSSRFTLVTTANFRPSCSTASATRCGSSKSIGIGLPFGHRTEAAPPRTEIAQQHEGCGAMVPALADVGAVRRLAYRVQIEFPSQRLEVVIILAHRRTRLQPLRFGSSFAWANLDLYEFGCRCHGNKPLYDARAYPVVAGGHSYTMRATLTGCAGTPTNRRVAAVSAFAGSPASWRVPSG